MGVGLSCIMRPRSKKRAKTSVFENVAHGKCFCCLPFFRGADIVNPEDPASVKVIDEKDTTGRGSPSGLERIRGAITLVNLSIESVC